MIRTVIYPYITTLKSVPSVQIFIEAYIINQDTIAE